MNATLTHHAFCGMPSYLVTKDDQCSMEEVRSAAAKEILSLRRQGYPVHTLEKGKEWEVQEPDDCAMVPDECGLLVIREIQPKLIECCNCRYEFEEGCSHDCSDFLVTDETDEDIDEE